MKQWLLNIWKAQDNASMVDWLREKEADLEAETDRLRREIRGYRFSDTADKDRKEARRVMVTAAKPSADKQLQREMR